MAKPYSDQAGSGLHVHASIIDRDGNNILDAKGGEPAMLKSVTAGMLQTDARGAAGLRPLCQFLSPLPAGLVCAGRSRPGVAGIAARQSAFPIRNGPAARVEHRVAGADANPYLLLATILGGMLLGLDGDLDPGEETTPAYTPPRREASDA